MHNHGNQVGCQSQIKVIRQLTSLDVTPLVNVAKRSIIHLLTYSIVQSPF